MALIAGDWEVRRTESIGFNYSLLGIIILFGCLKREIPLVGTTASTTIGFAYFAKIITTPSDLSVRITWPRQPLPCPDQGVQCLSHLVAARTHPIFPTLLGLGAQWASIPLRHIPQLCATDGELRTMGVTTTVEITSWIAQYKVDQQSNRGMIPIECWVLIHVITPSRSRYSLIHQSQKGQN